MTKELKKILYIEDEPDIIQIAKIALEDIGGFKLKCFQSGRTAIQEVNGFMPDLILIDVMMPEMDGPTTLRELRKLPVTEKTPVIFMTAKAQPNEIKEYISLGAIDVITKPFDPMTLADTIKSLWAKIHE